MTFMLLLALLLAVPTATASASSSPTTNVLPATSRPYGISLTDMAQRSALFESQIIAGVTPTPTPPSSPFQFLALTSSSYTVNSHTMLYVPVFTVDDSPPVTGCPQPGIPGTPGCIGTFPGTNSAAVSYVFGAQRMGGHDMAITIDRAVTPLGPSYLAGPVTQSNPPLADGGGTHELVVGAYVAPLPVGNHSVTISGVFDGPYLGITYPGLTSLPFTLTYNVNVTP